MRLSEQIPSTPLNRQMLDQNLALRPPASPQRRPQELQRRLPQSPLQFKQQPVYQNDMQQQYNQFNGIHRTQSEQGEYQPKVVDFTLSSPEINHQQMQMPKTMSAPSGPASLPATPSKLSLPLGQYDDMRPFIVKQRNREYNSLKEQVLAPILDACFLVIAGGWFAPS